MDFLALNMADADVRFYPNFFSEQESQMYFQQLMEEIAWKQEYINLFGRKPCPRLEAWYGDKGKNYTYSGIEKHPLEWTKTLLFIKNRVEQVASTTFNSVLLNQYRTGKDSVSWHSDDEQELGQNPVIASVSFGAERIFHFKHEHDKSQKAKVLLTNGSLLIMAGETQHHWKHQIPKTKKDISPRINLTFRVIH